MSTLLSGVIKSFAYESGGRGGCYSCIITIHLSLCFVLFVKAPHFKLNFIPLREWTWCNCLCVTEHTRWFILRHNICVGICDLVKMLVCIVYDVTSILEVTPGNHHYLLKLNFHKVLRSEQKVSDSKLSPTHYEIVTKCAK